MDYPELNLLLGTGLVAVEGISVLLALALTRGKLPVFARRASLIYVGISLFAMLAIFSLFLRTMTPSFNLRILLTMAIAGGIVAGVDTWLKRKTITPPVSRLLFGLFILTTLASFLLAYGLYRAMVPLWLP